VFTNTHVPCTTGDYSGWFNFDSIPVLNKANQAVSDYFVNAPDSVTRYWLNQGADGWRLDVMGDASFPDDYWIKFRQVVKQTDPNALIVGELWQKDTATLRFLAGDRADSTMNYRDRDAILGFLTTHPFDGKGLGDSGRVLAPSEFLSRLVSQQEDYAKPAYFALMNLIDSHDTTRALWTLSAGADNDPAAKAANVANGKLRLRLASLVQYALAGMPTARSPGCRRSPEATGLWGWPPSRQQRTCVAGNVPGKGAHKRRAQPTQCTPSDHSVTLFLARRAWTSPCALRRVEMRSAARQRELRRGSLAGLSGGSPGRRGGWSRR